MTEQERTALTPLLRATSGRACATSTPVLNQCPAAAALQGTNIASLHISCTLTVMESSLSLLCVLPFASLPFLSSSIQRYLFVKDNSFLILLDPCRHFYLLINSILSLHILLYCFFHHFSHSYLSALNQPYLHSCITSDTHSMLRTTLPSPSNCPLHPPPLHASLPLISSDS